MLEIQRSPFESCRRKISLLTMAWNLPLQRPCLQGSQCHNWYGKKFGWTDPTPFGPHRPLRRAWYVMRGATSRSSLCYLMPCSVWPISPNCMEEHHSVSHSPQSFSESKSWTTSALSISDTAVRNLMQFLYRTVRALGESFMSTDRVGWLMSLS